MCACAAGGLDKFELSRAVLELTKREPSTREVVAMILSEGSGSDVLTSEQFARMMRSHDWDSAELQDQTLPEGMYVQVSYSPQNDLMLLPLCFFIKAYACICPSRMQRAMQLPAQICPLNARPIDRYELTFEEAELGFLAEIGEVSGVSSCSSPNHNL